MKDSSSKRSLTSKGLATRASILDAAHQVFKEMGYYGSSISEITRRLHISMGNFYQYFKNKEQVFLELNDFVISRFMSRAESLPREESSLRKRLHQVIQLLYDHTRENFAFHRILGESELIDRVTIAYYESIARYYRDFFRRSAQKGEIRVLDPNLLAYALIGICYFNSRDWGQRAEAPGGKRVIDLTTDLVMNGISGRKRWRQPKELTFSPPSQPFPLPSQHGEPLSKGEKTRQAIFRAAERVFGRQGFNRANIADITREARVAQGTFYIHFGSKNDLIEGFVKYINRELRRELQRAVAGLRDRRDVERAGMLAFYDFLRHHRAIYKLVPEFEMIDPQVGMWYYEQIAQGYSRGLELGLEKGEIRDLPVLFLVRSLMGVTHFIGLKWIVWNPTPKAELPKPLFKDLMEFIFFGVRPE